jgi:hypothetical protein
MGVRVVKQQHINRRKVFAEPSWHGRTAHETRAGCPCHGGENPGAARSSGNGRETDRRSGMAMLEFILVIGAIMIPFFIALSEVYRVEYVARRMVYSAQAESIERASRGSWRARDRTNYLPEDVMNVPVRETVRLSRPAARLFPDWRAWPVSLSRTYYICHGTGRD